VSGTDTSTAIIALLIMPYLLGLLPFQPCTAPSGCWCGSCLTMWQVINPCLASHVCMLLLRCVLCCLQAYDSPLAVTVAAGSVARQHCSSSHLWMEKGGPKAASRAASSFPLRIGVGAGVCYHQHFCMPCFQGAEHCR